MSWSTEFNLAETSCVVCTILEKLKKNCKESNFLEPFGPSKVIFFNGPSKWVLFFLRCNQCIKTLLLSYQTSISKDFHFHLCKGVPSPGQLKKEVPTCLKLVKIWTQKNIFGNSRAKGMQWQLVELVISVIPKKTSPYYSALLGNCRKDRGKVLTKPRSESTGHASHVQAGSKWCKCSSPSIGLSSK